MLWNATSWMVTLPSSTGSPPSIACPSWLTECESCPGGQLLSALLASLLCLGECCNQKLLPVDAHVDSFVKETGRLCLVHFMLIRIVVMHLPAKLQQQHLSLSAN